MCVEQGEKSITYLATNTFQLAVMMLLLQIYLRLESIII